MHQENEIEINPIDLKLDVDGRSTDWYLQKLVSIVNKTNLEISITLIAEGAIISGLLVSGRRYFEIFANEISDAFPGEEESKEIIRQAFASNADIYNQDENDIKQDPPQFIHLLDAHCHLANGSYLPGGKGVLWRGKVNSISGFSLGSISLE